VPGMAVFSAAGFLLLIGAPYNSIVVVMPFLMFGKFNILLSNFVNTSDAN